MDKPVKLSDKEIKAIEATLAKGERVEIIPVKDGVKVVRVKRETIKSLNICGGGIGRR